MNGLGWRPDTPDFRDRVFSTQGVIKHFDDVPLPLKVDLRRFMPRVYNQGSLGSCTANSALAMCHYLASQKNTEAPEFSRLFTYYCTRELEGTIPVDCGASLRNTIKAINLSGGSYESDWPYKIELFAQTPPQAVFEFGQLHQALKYERLQTLRDMRTCLAAGFPFVFGFSVYESLYSLSADDNFRLSFPSPDQSLLGGHAVTAVGYDDEAQVFIIRNSWGADWGEAGHFYMPYEYALNSNLAADFWTIQLMEFPGI